MSSEKHDQEHDGDAEAEEVRAEIERTREQLGDTVEALAHKADVKGRVSEGIEDRKQQARERADHVRETVSQTAEQAREQAAAAADSVRQTAEQKVPRDRIPMVAGAAVAAIAVLLVVRRRRARAR